MVVVAKDWIHRERRVTLYSGRVLAAVALELGGTVLVAGLETVRRRLTTVADVLGRAILGRIGRTWDRCH